MQKFRFIKTKIDGLTIIEPCIFEDERGYFMETYNYEEFRRAGIDVNFVQDNQSRSKKGVLRGLHFQTKHSQGKLVRVVKGEVFDVAVDLRRESVTFGRYCGVRLSGERKNQFYIPKNFAHGFLVLSDEAEFIYKCTDFYDPDNESGIIWNDSDLDIKWPIMDSENLLLSNKDKKFGSFKDYKTNLGIG